MVCRTYAVEYSANAYIKSYYIHWCSLVYQGLQRKSLTLFDKYRIINYKTKGAYKKLLFIISFIQYIV